MNYRLLIYSAAILVILFSYSCTNKYRVIYDEYRSDSIGIKNTYSDKPVISLFYIDLDTIIETVNSNGVTQLETYILPKVEIIISNSSNKNMIIKMPYSFLPSYDNIKNVINLDMVYITDTNKYWLVDFDTKYYCLLNLDANSSLSFYSYFPANEYKIVSGAPQFIGNLFNEKYQVKMKYLQGKKASKGLNKYDIEALKQFKSTIRKMEKKINQRECINE
ncbi:MAG: hypothetical protein JEZ03_14695 [Bacteroidales bacterium]|nr:hypothetical protein [Bacteroidales bacterium]